MLAILLEGVNNKIFKVNFKNLIFLFVWVLSCVNVGNSDAYSEVKCQSACFYNEKSDKCSVLVRIGEKLLTTIALRERYE